MATPTKSVEEQIAEHEAAIKKLKESQLAGYEAEYETVSKRANELRNLISSIKGTPIEPPTRGSQTKAAKKVGIQVSVDRLETLIKEAGGELSIRGGKGKPYYDITTIKKHVEAFPKKFKLGGKSPWPTVLLA